MKCHECNYLMFDYLDGKLPIAEKMDLESHLGECPACAERLARLKQSQEEEKPTGLFWYLWRPSGGFKRFFFLGAIFTCILVLLLISFQMKWSLF